jgi:branched-chain amino acid transport system permease protein
MPAKLLSARIGKGIAVGQPTGASRVAAATGVGLVALAATLPFWGELSWMREFREVACWLVFAMTWNLLAGYGGMVSIGQHAYFGLGGYGMVILANEVGLNPFVAVPLAALAAGAAAWPLSRIAFRLQGGYFAIGTWVIAEVLRLSFANVTTLGGGSGTSLTALQGIPRSTREALTFWLALAAVVATVLLTWRFLRSRQGLALLAIRDSEVAAAAQGVDVARTRLAVYLAAGFGAGLAGAIYFLGNLRISPDAAFSVNWTAFCIFIVLIGGIGTIEGPIVGTLVFWLLGRYFSDYGSWYLVGLGLLAAVIVVRFPQGLWGCVRQGWGVRLFPIERRLADGDGANRQGPAETTRRAT